MFEKASSLAVSVVSVLALFLIFVFVLEWVCDVGRLKGKSKLLGVSEDEWFPRLKAHFRYCADGFRIIHNTIDEVCSPSEPPLWLLSDGCWLIVD
jgi:hypothetical protein